MMQGGAVGVNVSLESVSLNEKGNEKNLNIEKLGKFKYICKTPGAVTTLNTMHGFPTDKKRL